MEIDATIVETEGEDYATWWSICMSVNGCEFARFRFFSDAVAYVVGLGGGRIDYAKTWPADVPLVVA